MSHSCYPIAEHEYSGSLQTAVELLYQQPFQTSEIQILQQLNELLELYYRLQHDPKFYAARMKKSVFRMNQITMFHCGKTMYTLIRDRLHLESRILLLHSSLSVKEICYALGFCDPSHFVKRFKKKEGFTPKQYRKVFRVKTPVLFTKTPVY